MAATRRDISGSLAMSHNHGYQQIVFFGSGLPDLRAYQYRIEED